MAEMWHVTHEALSPDLAKRLNMWGDRIKCVSPSSETSIHKDARIRHLCTSVTPEMFNIGQEFVKWRRLVANKATSTLQCAGDTAGDLWQRWAIS